MPTEGWALELQGNALDLDDVKYDLAEPFDPWFEAYTDDGRDIVLLRTAAWEGIEGTGTLMEHAGRLLDQLNGAKLIQYEDARPMSFGEIYRFDGAGERMPVTIELTAHGMIAVGRMRARLTAVGDGERPQPPKRSALQTHIALGMSDSRIADLLTFISRADNWFDLYKAIELLEQVAGRKLKDHLKGWDRVRQTANSYRHAPGSKNNPPDPPSTLAEARSLVREAARLVLRRRPEDATKD